MPGYTHKADGSMLVSFCRDGKTVFPKPGGKVWYDDQREVHRQIIEGDESVDYAFMGEDANAHDNRWLRDAYENKVPIIYFLGVAPGRYQPVLPCFISGWEPKELKAPDRDRPRLPAARIGAAA